VFINCVKIEVLKIYVYEKAHMKIHINLNQVLYSSEKDIIKCLEKFYEKS